MTKLDWFGSRYYKLLYNNRNEDEACSFLRALTSYLQPAANSKMLDIACGEGRFAKLLAEDGYDVTGIDLSVPNIEKAKLSETETLHFYVQDMRFPFFINYFDYAFNFFTSFGYFKYDRDHVLAAKAFAAGVKQGGTLVIDYLNADFILPNLVAEATIEREGITFFIKKAVERGHIIKNITFTDTEGQTQNVTETVATFSLQDFKQMFEPLGMKLIDVFGDYKLQAYDSRLSQRMIMVFNKI